MKSALLALSLVAGCSTLDIDPTPNIADGDTGVALIATFEIPIDSATPASSVDNSAFALIDDRGFQLAAEVSFDPEEAIAEIVPVRPMVQDTTYTLSSELVARDGDNIEISFATLANPLFRQIFFVLGTVEPTSYIEFASDDMELTYDAPGPDLVWPSDDDVLGSYRVTQERIGDTQLVVTFGPGVDGEFFTADDAPLQYQRRLFEGPLAVRDDRFLVGADEQVETADDTPSLFRENRFNVAGQLDGIALYADGGDGIPGSSDDQPLLGFVITYDQRGLSERGLVQIDAGPDGELLTADDIIPDGPPTNLYDERGVYLGSLSEVDRSTNFVDNRGASYREDFYGAGRDGVVQTADDQINFRLEYTAPP